MKKFLLMIFILLIQLSFSQILPKYPDVDSLNIRESITYKFLGSWDPNGQSPKCMTWTLDGVLMGKWGGISGLYCDTMIIRFDHQIFDGKVHTIVSFTNNYCCGGSGWFLKTTDNTKIEVSLPNKTSKVVGPTYIYNINGKKMSNKNNLRPGIYLVKTGNVTKRFVITY